LKADIELREFRVEIMPDEDPDLTYLGYFTDNISDVDRDKYCIILDTKGASHCKYFVSSFNYEELGPDERSKYAHEDYKRMVDYSKYKWMCVHIRPEAIFDVIINGESVADYSVKGIGVGGVDYEFDRDGYIKSVIMEEIDELKYTCVQMGFDVPDDSEFETVWYI
jgi:hypothetical protein